MDHLLSELGTLVWGKLEEQPGYGNNYFGKSEFGEQGWPGFGISGYGINEFGISNFYPLIFQRRKLKEISGYVRILWYDYVIKHSDHQQLHRLKFKAGVSVWKILEPEEKEEWKEEARTFGIFGINLFLREWMLA